MLVLFVTISAILRPYYEIQRDIDKILTHIEAQTKQQESNAENIDLVEEDMAILVRTLHTLLRIEAGEDIDRKEVEELLKYFEETIIYENIGAIPEAEDSASSAIGKITKETLNALKAVN